MSKKLRPRFGSDPEDAFILGTTLYADVSSFLGLARLGDNLVGLETIKPYRLTEVSVGVVTITSLPRLHDAAVLRPFALRVIALLLAGRAGPFPVTAPCRTIGSSVAGERRTSRVSAATWQVSGKKAP